MDEAYTEKNKKNPISVMQIRNSSISDEASSFSESRQLTPDSRANKSITLNKKDIIKKLSKIKTEKIEPREFLNKLKQAFGLNEKENSNYVDLTEEYNKSYSENDIWENINKTAEKENIRTLNNEISIALINTSRKKEHIVFGDGFKNHPQIKRHKIYLMNLEKLINNAKYVGTENNQKPSHKNKKEVILYHYFETTVKIDERFYKVRFGTEELSEKETERYKKIGKLPPSTVSSKMSNLQTIWLSSPNEYSIAHGKNLSSTVPKQNYLYKIGERSLGRDYLNQIQNSQNKSPIKMDVRPMQNQTEENKMQKHYTNLKGFVANSGSSFGRTEIAVDRENGTITVNQSGEQPVMPGAEMNWNGFSLVDFEHQDENTRYHKYTAELNERTAAFAEEIRKKALNNINPEDYEATTEYPESEALSKAGWEWVRYQDGSGGLQDSKKLSPYNIGYDNATNEGWIKDKNRNETDFFYRTGYDDEGVEIFDLEKFKTAAEEKIANLLNINIKHENTMQEQNKQTQAQKDATNFVLDKLAEAEIEVVTDKTEMREILNSGKLVQKMAAYHGTSHEGEIDNAFNGFGTYVVSVNTDVAKEQGMKIASKKYGDAFYIKSNGKEQTLDRFLSEHGYSPYWSELLKQTRFDDVAKLQHEIMATDTKGNSDLENQKSTLSVLLSAGVIEYKREKTYLYSIDIPDNNGKNYLFYENSIGLEAANTINAALEKIGVEWRVDRRDPGRQVYFNTLSEKVFNKNQEQASKFLKNTGFAGMEMNSSNYIIFDEKDIVVNKRIQYMMDGNGEVYGFTLDGKIYLDPDLMNSNTPVHEYTHIWDAYTQRTNPELWEKGKAVLQQTHLWQEVVDDPNYAEIADDEDLVLSEVHSRICGAMAEKVLERIAEQDGEIAKDRAIDWDKETWDYIESKLLPTTERSSEFIRNGGSFLNLKEFLATPMQDFMNGRLIGKERNVERAGVETDSSAVNYELDRIQEAGIEVDADKEVFKEKLSTEERLQKMVDDYKFPSSDMYFKFDQKDSENFVKQVFDWEENNLNPGKMIEVGKIPPLMKAIGIPDLPIEIEQRTIVKALQEEPDPNYGEEKHGHALDIEEVKQIPQLLADPIMVFKSKTRDDSYVFFTEQRNKNGKSIIIPLAVNKNMGRIRINKITSMYGKDNEASFVKENIKNGNLVYSDERRYEQWNRETEKEIQTKLADPKIKKESRSAFESQVQFLTHARSLNSTSNILLKENLVNFISSQNQKKIQKHVEPTEQNTQPALDDVVRVLGEAGLGVGFQRANENGEWENAQIKFYKDNGESMVIDDIDLSAGGERKAELLKANIEKLANSEGLNPETKEKLIQASKSLEELFDKSGSFADALRESDKSIEEATNGFGHDPTDGFPKDFNPEDERKPMGYYEDGTPFWGDEEENAPPENVDMYTAKDGKLFYPHEIIPNDVSDILSDSERQAENEVTEAQAENEVMETQEVSKDHEPERTEDFTVPDTVRVAIYESDAVDAVRAQYGDDYLMRTGEIYANEICSILEKFSEEKSSDWNIGQEDKVAIHHLMGISGIGIGERGDSVKKIREYFTTPEYEANKEQLGAMFAGIIETKNEKGYGYYFSAELKSIMTDKNRHVEAERILKAEAAKEKLSEMGIKDGKIPEFSMISQGGLKTYKDMSVAEYNPESGAFTLARYEKMMVEEKDENGKTLRVERDVAVEKAVLTQSGLKELMSEERAQKAQSFGENTSAYDKLLETQYNDFFKVRDNTANNFRHNLSVYCRRQCNSPLDAISAAGDLIKAMPVEERRKTKEIMKKICRDGETVNQAIVGIYHEAVKDVPLNEDYLKSKRYDKIVARPMFDTVSAKGAQVDPNFSLCIGDTIGNIAFKVDKTFGIGKETLRQNCTIVSSSKEGNTVTLMDGNKSFYNVPRDTFLKEYAQQQKREQKQDRSRKNAMRLEIER